MQRIQSTSIRNTGIQKVTAALSSIPKLWTLLTCLLTNEYMNNMLKFYSVIKKKDISICNSIYNLPCNHGAVAYNVAKLVREKQFNSYVELEGEKFNQGKKERGKQK